MTAALARLRERKLAQWALAYLAGAWLLLQVLDLLGGTFNWPQLVQQIASLLLGVGFLAALVLAWFHGEKGEQRVGGIELAIFAVLCILAGAVVSVAGGGVRGRDAVALAERDTRAVAPVAQDGIAVLPFVNMSGIEENEYFSDGVTEEILNALARLPGLRVPARTSSFFFKGKNLPVGEIARQLRVAHVLEGSVRRVGDRVRITAQLVDARSDQHLWSATYDRELRDIFAVQDEIARAIAGALQLRLSAPSGVALVRTPTADPGAYELYLRGRHFLNRRTAPHLLRAISFFERAIERDPGYAQAHAGLAQAYAVLPLYGSMRQSEAEARAMRAAEEALRIDSLLPDAYVALGKIHQGSFRWPEAKRAYRRAIELNPSDPTVHLWYGQVLFTSGPAAQAPAEFERARELDPLSAVIGYSSGAYLIRVRRYDEAIRLLVATVELDPEHPTTRYFLGRAYLAKGEQARAIAELERALTHSPDRWSPIIGALAHAYAVSGRTAEARRLLAELHRRAEREAILPSTIALVHTGLGEKDEAFRWLDRAVAERDQQLSLGSFHDLHWDPLRSDPRFRRLLEKAGLR